MRREKQVTTTVRVTGQLEYSDIIALVRRAVPDAPANAEITITVYVPGGGDWSNTDLDVEEHPLEFVCTWASTSES